MGTRPDIWSLPPDSSSADFTVHLTSLLHLKREAGVYSESTPKMLTSGFHEGLCYQKKDAQGHRACRFVPGGTIRIGLVARYLDDGVCFSFQVVDRFACETGVF